MAGTDTTRKRFDENIRTLSILGYGQSYPVQDDSTIVIRNSKWTRVSRTTPRVVEGLRRRKRISTLRVSRRLEHHEGTFVDKD